MIKTIIISILVSLYSLNAGANKKESKEKLSLPKATVAVGLPALIVTTAIWAPQLTKDKHLWNNFTRGFKNPPVWDQNPWYVNYIGHPIFGAEAYLLARNRDYSILTSFLYSTAASVVWEYGIESWHGARPSIQDLTFTSTLGSLLLGEPRYIIKNMLINNDDLVSKIFVVILDPTDACLGLFE